VKTRTISAQAAREARLTMRQTTSAPGETRLLSISPALKQGEEVYPVFNTSTHLGARRQGSILPASTQCSDKDRTCFFV
jgi:hypothetical protein